MATTPVTLNIDSSIVAQAEQALAWKNGWQATIPDPNNPGQTIPNPVTIAQNAKLSIKQFVENAMLDYANMQAIQAVVPPVSNLIS